MGTKEEGSGYSSGNFNNSSGSSSGRRIGSIDNNGDSDSNNIATLTFEMLMHRIVDEVAIFVIGNLPQAKIIAVEAFETIFATKTLCRQLALACVLETGVLALNQFYKIVNSVIGNLFASSRTRLIRNLTKQQDVVQTQDEWMDLAERIDSIQGNDAWRSDDRSPLYEPHRISARIDEFVHLMRRRDIFELMFVLRGGIGRNKFGLLHEGLFSKAMAGTKVLIETYHNVVCASLDYVCDAPVCVANDNNMEIPSEAKLAFFNETRHSYGRTALLLSGGAALGFYHVGVVKTLMENRLMPRVLGGSSAGSIVCAMIGTRTNEECTQDLFNVVGTSAPGHSGRLMYNFFRPLNIPGLVADNTNDNNSIDHHHQKYHRIPSDCNDIGEVYQNTAGFLHDMKRTFQTIFIPIPLRNFTSVLYDLITLKTRPQELFMSDTEHFRECIRINVGDFTFQEAFDRTGRILNITVTPINSSDPPRLLNYLTAPHVLVWSAVVASSSLPGVFESNRLMVKDADGTVRYESAEWNCDGSMEQDLPMQQLSEMFNVNHFIISQANPHAVMFGSYSHSKSIWSGPFRGIINSVLTFLKNQCRSWLSHLVELVGARRFAPQHATSRQIGAQFFVQEYEGRDCDISLIPWIGHRNVFSALLHALYNPNEIEFRQWIEAAQRETWKYIPTIKSHVAEEITLDQCVQRLRKRIVQESIEKRERSSRGRRIENLNASMHKGVPDFFVSPSLVNLGGLGIGDQACVLETEDDDDDDHHVGSRQHQHPSLRSPKHHHHEPILLPHVDIRPGWSGMGLKGNRSAGSLESHASGLFIDNIDYNNNDSGSTTAAENYHHHSPYYQQQMPGEQTNHEPYLERKRHLNSLNRSSNNNSISSSLHSQTSSINNNNEIQKTTNMANFYYRNSYIPKSRSHGEYSNNKNTMMMMKSDDGNNHKDIDNQNNGKKYYLGSSSLQTRQKSKSHTSLI